MQARKKIVVITFLSALTIAGIAATDPDKGDKKFKNLKVLSKHITDQQMERIMYTFERQLGVTCMYCHVPTKNVIPERVDFASDEKPEKLVARQMLKMTIKINKKYFNKIVDKSYPYTTRPTVWCRTCHRGLPVPKVWQSVSSLR
jgi:hypothetical protein